jgi:2-phospho-L-lactate transferase/gluconeogenesis factor (CofD/UPF0052 family)
VATQHGETDSFTVSDHFRALTKHTGHNLFDYVVANSNVREPLPDAWNSEPVRVDDELALDGARVLTGDVVCVDNRYHHDPKKLADTLIRLYYQRPETEVLVEEPQAENAIAVKM